MATFLEVAYPWPHIVAIILIMIAMAWLSEKFIP